MKTEKLNYYLPDELIAQQPLPVRSDSRLLVLNRSNGDILDSRFNRIGDFLLRGDCLVLNDTKVLAARFFAQRVTGGKIEGLFLAEEEKGVWRVYLKGARKIKPGETFYLQIRNSQDAIAVRLIDKDMPGQCRIKFESNIETMKVLDEIGYPPLPPYIKRGNDLKEAEIDRLRYQTVYARQGGAVAAPTAGLHFTPELMESLGEAGIDFAYVTLHTSAGTFLPVVTDELEDHKIHEEIFSIDDTNAQKINTVKKNGGRIIAVGTTSVRSLETAARLSQIQAAAGLTDIFITPGYEFKITDAIITNFHLPKSSLLALVAAFAGLENVLRAYEHAVEQRYRFYSYGDAMLIV
jgi:S-adenosylmethionine:tRNA ribosyltransferase-isomerase